MEEEIQVLVANTASQIRKETVDGKEWYVASGVLLVEDVLVANNGAIFYPAPEIKKTAPDWDEAPILLGHPKKDGKFVSVHSDEAFLPAMELGYVTKTKWDKKLKTEYRFDMEKCDKVSANIRTKLDEGKPINVSTGLGMKIEKKEAKFKGKPYVGIAREHQPDHVALLLDEKGACDLDMGCGCLTGNQTPPVEVLPFAANELSFDRTRSLISQQLNKSSDHYSYVMDVYSDFFIYQGRNSKLFRQAYTASDDEVTISDSPAIEVKWVTEYRTLAGAYVGNCACSQLKENDVDKKTKIATIVANGVWKAEDLEKFSDTQLDSLLPKPVPTPVPAVVPPVLAANQTPAPVSIEDSLNTMPPEVQAVLRPLIEADKNKRITVVANLNAAMENNPNGKFKPEWIEKQPTDALELILSQVVKPAPVHVQAANSYLGAATLPPTLSANSGALPAPMVGKTIDFPAK